MGTVMLGNFEEKRALFPTSATKGIRDEFTSVPSPAPPEVRLPSHGQPARLPLVSTNGQYRR